ncbi:MAG: cytidine deaminase [Alphaproteobacteria bacterium]|nr:cytidine deaminase [Alphaproteobacteria bacterium]
MSDLTSLFNKALKVRKNAYAPYSQFHVGATVLSSNNNVYLGCNVENVSYPNGTCAETGAIAAMVAGGDVLIKDIVVVADSKLLIKPCGACLQRIFEFSNGNTKVHLADLGGIKKTYLISELLPLAFNEEELKK